MGFLAPWFLAGLAVIGLPFWIHLLRQYRSTPHPFSSLMFFERRTQSSIKHRRLRYLLLLSLRVALLLLLALAFANPFVTPIRGQLRLPQNAVDCRGQFFQHALRRSSGPREAGSSERCFESQRRRTRPGSGDRLAHSHARPSRWKKRISSRPPSNPFSPPMNAAPMANWRERCAPSHNPPACRSKSISSATCRNRRCLPSFADLRLGLDTNLIFHSVADSKEPNWLVESVTAPGKIYDPKKVQRAGRDCRHRNRCRETDRVAGRWMAGCSKANRWTFQPADVPASNSCRSNRPMDSTKPRSGSNQLTRCLRTTGFHSRWSAPIRIRCCFCTPPASNSGELYYRSALESVTEAGFVLEPLAVEQAANQALSKYAFVVLSDVSSLPPGLENSLRAYVNGGGSLLVALGPLSAALAHVPGFGRSHPRNQLRRTRRRPIPDRRHRRCRASLRCAAPTSWMACSSTRWSAWIPASRASSPA